MVEGVGNFVALSEGGGDVLAPNAERKDGGGGAVRRELPFLAIALGILVRRRDHRPRPLPGGQLPGRRAWPTRSRSWCRPPSSRAGVARAGLGETFDVALDPERPDHRPGLGGLVLLGIGCIPIWAPIVDHRRRRARRSIGIIVFRRIRAARAARALEKAIAQQAQEQALAAKPERVAEIQELHRQIQQGIDALKASKLGGGKRGADALYVLPWYVMVGPPGAGKTTALRHSGLVFPYLDPVGRRRPRRRRHAQLRLVVHQRGDPPRHRRPLHDGGRRPRRVDGLPRAAPQVPRREAAQRRHRRRQRQRAARRDRRADPADGGEDPRAHRRDAGDAQGDPARST